MRASYYPRNTIPKFVPEFLWNYLERITKTYERRGIIGKTLFWSGIIFVVGIGIDTIVHSFGWPWIYARNLGEAVIIGTFIYTVLDLREKRLKRRFKELGYLNHHIRNSLTIIEMAEGNIAEAEQRLEMIKKATSRIKRCVEKISREEDCEIDEKVPSEP